MKNERHNMGKNKDRCVEVFNDILKLVADGSSLTKALNSVNVNIRDFFEVIDNDENLANEYARAREQRGESCIGRITDYEEDLKNKKIDPATARVLIDTEKWLACKMYPKMYGEKQAVEVTGANGSPLAPPIINIQPVKVVNETESDNG